MPNYNIKEGYQINEVNRTIDSNPNKLYWTKSRIHLSQRYQYNVYLKGWELAKQHNCKSILDLGCGPAKKLNLLFKDGFKIFGVDQQSTIDICKKIHKSGNYITENLEKPQLKLKSFIEYADMIICADVIEHMSDPQHILNYIKHFSTKKTLILLSTPERDTLLGKDAMQPSNPSHIREWQLDEFRKYLEENGFTIINHYIDWPFKFGFNFFTFKYILNRMTKGLPLKNNQVVICKLKS